MSDKRSIQCSRRIFACIDAITRCRFAAIALAFFLSFSGSWLFSVFRGIQVPNIHDEFSYLLAADTFAHGRITNPTHPMWVHFETFWVLQKPTYMSMYPPGQGFFLALGQIIFGHPIYGVWLSTGLMCAAICWMLYAFLTPRWALVGGLVAVLQFGIFTYWSQSYWGGAVAATAGALIFGALQRIFLYKRTRDAVWLGVGCALLANSRPLEGFLAAVPVGCLIFPWKIAWEQVVTARFVKRIVLPLAAVLLMAVCGMGVYNKKTTGDACILPHLLYDHTCRDLPLFIWQPYVHTTKFSHEIIRRFETYIDEKNYNDKRTWKGFVHDVKSDAVVTSMFFLGYPLAVPSLLVLVFYFFYRPTAARFWAALLIILGIFAAKTRVAQPHYFSAMTGAAVLLVTVGLRVFAVLKLYNLRVGLRIVLFLIVLQLFLNITLTPVQPAVQSLAVAALTSPQQVKLPHTFTRDGLIDVLTRQGGKYLVLVSYGGRYVIDLDWVYNGADIDGAPIVWARDMGRQRNKELLEYFKDRRVLYVHVVWGRRYSRQFPYHYARF